MGFIFILPVTALAGWAIFAIFRWLRRANFGPKWWRAYGMLGSIGLALGIWFAFFFQYKVANAKLDGFPIPAGIAMREKPDAPYKAGDMPTAIRIGANVADILSGIAICVAPIAVAAFFKENRGKGAFAGPRPS